MRGPDYNHDWPAAGGGVAWAAAAALLHQFICGSQRGADVRAGIQDLIAQSDVSISQQGGFIHHLDSIDQSQHQRKAALLKPEQTEQPESKSY